MKRFSSFLLLISLLSGLSMSSSSVMAQTFVAPEAECVRDVFTISNLPKDGKKVAIRIDNNKNAWNLAQPFQGDIAGTVTPKDGKYVVNALYGDTYNWWVHLENTDGSYGKAYGGTLHCGNGAPTDFKYVCEGNKITFSWKPVKDTSSYSIRVDDKANSWDEKNALKGDIVKNDIKQTSYEMETTKGKRYDAWIHAVDTKKNYSSAKKIAVSCASQEKAEVSFWDSVTGFFASLFR